MYSEFLAFSHFFFKASPKTIRRWNLTDDPSNLMISYIHYGIDIYYNGNGRIFHRNSSTLKELFLPKVITVTWPSIPLEGKLTWYVVTSHDNQDWT